MPLNVHRMKYFKCQVRLPYKLIVIFCVLCIARECQSIAYIGNLTKSRTFFIHNFYATDTFWKDSVQYNGDAIVLGVFFFITDTSVCSYIHLLIAPSSTSRLNILWIECTKKFKNIQSMFTYMYSTYHVVSFFFKFTGWVLSYCN